jgi:DNA-binding NarL/FixJ family response regulator
MSPAHLLLIDDHAMFRSGLVALFRLSMSHVQVTEAASVSEALQHAPPAPDVVLLDIVLRGLNGIEGIDLIQRAWPQVPIVMVSSDASPHTVRQALARGARAFVSKENSAEDVLGAVRRILAPASFSGGFVDTRTNTPDPPMPNTGIAPLMDPLADPVSEHLTPRQRQVLELLCKGLPNKAIGRKLDLSENTVRWHVQGILKFLQVSNRSEAAFAARAKGLIG